MRRPVAIAILMLFGLAPLFALIPGDEQAALPACCRRHGAHHCVMQMAASRSLDGSPNFAAPNYCPQYRAQVRAIAPVFVLPGAPLSHGEAGLRIAPAFPGSVVARRASAHAGRGPPALS